MEKYELITQIGDGTFGSVAKAVLKKTGQLVAIKKMKQKFYTWEECVKLPEVDVVRRIHGHPNVVKLREVIRENNELFFVFEYMDGDLLGVIKKAKLSNSGQPGPCISYAQTRSFMRQMLQALAYVHKRGYFHRDMKPENLLIRKEPAGEEVLKLADFGLVKEMRARPPFTDYVSTRWYRAPELLLQDRFYSSPVDIWAAGCIMAELITTRPLFPGTNEVDQLFKIMSVLGAPTEKTWAGGMHLAKKIRYTFPAIAGSGLAQVLPSHTPAPAMDLMRQMLTYDPKLRPTAEQCLQHPFLTAAAHNGSEPSAAALDQLAYATKRLQTGPQSAPPPLKGTGADAQAPQKAGCATADGSLSDGSPRKLYMLGRSSELALSPRPIAGLSPASLPAVSPAATSKVAPTEVPKVGPGEAGANAAGLPLLPQHATAAKRRSQETTGSTSLAKKLAGLKNVHAGNGKAPTYGTSAARAARSPSSLLSPTAAPAISPSKAALTPSGGVGGGQLSPRAIHREGRQLKMNAAQPMYRRVSKETDGAAPVTLSAPKRDVNLDELMDEFASEMSHLSGQTERRDSASNREDVSGAPSPTQDPVVALLGSHRYKKTGGGVGETTSLQPLKSNGQTRTTLHARARKSDDSTNNSAATELPRVEHTTKGVSPALKALLAKHKDYTARA